MKKYNINDSKKLLKLLKKSKNYITSNKIIKLMFEDIVTLSEKTYEKEGNNIACEKGCTACCKLDVEVSEPEIIYIYTYMSNILEKEQLDAFFNQIEDTVSIIKDIDDIDEYAKLQIPCVFLHNGACSIYEVRPFICREYHSYDRVVCDESFHNLYSTKIKEDYYRIFNKYMDIYKSNKLLLTNNKLAPTLLKIHKDKSFIDKYFK
jgi:Fe-S-cluster containining protein